MTSLNGDIKLFVGTCFTPFDWSAIKHYWYHRNVKRETNDRELHVCMWNAVVMEKKLSLLDY